MTQGIYVIRNITTGEEYIGSAHNIAARWHQHTKRLRAGNHHAPKLQRAWEEFGESAFAFETLREVDQEDELLLREAETMRERSPVYNVTILDLEAIRTNLITARARAAEVQREQEARGAYIRKRVAEMPDSAVNVFACECCGALHRLIWDDGQFVVYRITRDDTDFLKWQRARQEYDTTVSARSSAIRIETE